jgi:hypothetical protein
VEVLVRQRGKIERHEVNGVVPCQATESTCNCGVEHYQKTALAGQAKLDAPPPSIPRLGRNTPCPCGSGKKWKRCCGGNTEEGAT